jgi:hypothetical protein
MTEPKARAAGATEPTGRGGAWTEERHTREPKGRGAAWTEERGTSDEGRRRLKSGPEASGKTESDEGRRRLKAPRRRAEDGDRT